MDVKLAITKENHLGEDSMDIRLIALDLDGTLLDSHKDITDRTLDALARAENKGIEIVLTTGRLLKSAEHVADSIGLKNYIIASNGGIIINRDKEIIYKNKMDRDAIREVMKLGRKHEMYYHFYSEDAFYARSYVQEVIRYYSTRDRKIDVNVFDEDEEILNNNDINIFKFLFLAKDPVALNRLKSDLDNVKNVSISSSWMNNLEVMAKNTSKANGLKILCQELDIEAVNVMAIGDNENDMPMIEFAGIGVAMGNGIKPLKDIADYITTSNDDDGVARTIEKFILGDEF